jgi:aerobic-type carbon monoxide dehydrogenase small subunit (CoxS/CutS family)
MKKSIQFNLNGKQVSILVNGEESLLTVLRSYLEHTGTKYGCGLGQCGACTVLINKEPVQSCMTVVEDIEGKDILTIEGLASDEALHPIQKAFVGHDALQCGFCTPGMIMNAYGLLLRDPEPSREKIISEMEGNLCRCGSYNRIIDAIQTAAVEMKEKI